MTFSAENDLDFDFPNEPNTVQPEVVASEITRRKYDKTLYSKGAVVRASLEKSMQAQIEQRLQSMSGVPVGMTYRVNIVAIPKGTPGASNVLRALIELVLSQCGAKMTQAACRADVQARFPAYAVYKDWTKELPTWALKHAEMRVRSSAAPLSGLVLRKGSSLGDLHRAAKVACSKSTEDALTVKASITVTADSVSINGRPFKVTSNKINGKTYPFIRITQPALMKALKA